MKRSPLKRKVSIARSDPWSFKKWTPSKGRQRLDVSVKPRRAIVVGTSRKALRDEMDELVRQIIRRRDVYCIVCGTLSDLHPGHYITRKVLVLRWDLRNVHAQCDACNSWHNEHPENYRIALAQEIWEIAVKELERIGRLNPRVEYPELLEIRDGLRAELAALKRKAA